MAKKSAPKKKATAAKTKAVKSSKPTKPAKTVAKVDKPLKKAKQALPAKSVKATTKAVKPALMTQKGKVTKQTEEVTEKVVTQKPQTIVSMLEAGASEDIVKVEKVSKVKPVKVERGNLADEKAKWIELNRKYGKEKAWAYKMTESYPSLVPLQHKVLGWGYILTNENDRLEVLFENGIRMLISNYKS